jgi:hypothetical protein
VEYYFEEKKGSLSVDSQDLSKDASSRYLALSSLRIELAKLMALNNYVISHEISNMSAYSLYVSGSVVKFLPRSNCKMLVTDGGVVNRLYCLFGLLNISGSLFQLRRKGYSRKLTSLQKKALQLRALLKKIYLGACFYFTRLKKNVLFVISDVSRKIKNTFHDLVLTPKKRIKNSSRVIKNKVDLNVYFFDLRPSYFVAKFSYFLPIIKIFLEKGRTVQLIIDGGRASAETQEKLKKLCNDFLGENNTLCFIYIKKSQSYRWTSIVESLKLLSGHLLKNSLVEVLLLKKALFLNDFYMNLVSNYPAKNWLGLIDSYQMTMINEAVKSFDSKDLVASIQFGTPDYTQLPYRYYRSDVLFTYDESSSEIYQSLDINCQCVVTGSLEKDALLGKFFRKNNDRVIVLFFDQPILQREDYSEELVRKTYQFLSRIAKTEGVDVLVKCHPRRPREVLERELDCSFIRFVDGERLGESLMKSTFAISFVSALLDVAAYAGSIPVSIGGSRFYSNAQKNSFEEVGGIITEDVGELEKLINLSSTDADFRCKLVSKVEKTQQSYYSQPRPSGIIYDYLMGKK